MATMEVRAVVTTRGGTGQRGLVGALERVLTWVAVTLVFVL